MIQEYIDRFQEIKPELLKSFGEKQPDSYEDILEQTLRMMFKGGDYKEHPSYDEITVIDHGYYQGTKVFIIPECASMPHKYFCVKVFYGSCSGCDTYLFYCAYDKEGYKESAPHMVTMALHMIESMKEI